MLHGPSIRVNLIFVGLLGNVGIKVSFESNNIVMTENNVFRGVRYCDQGLFVVNIYEVVNESASRSFTYIVDFYDVWHARLGHVSSLCY